MSRRISNVRSDAGQQKNLSKLLAKVLRHHPEMLELKLDDGGWASVRDLLAALNRKGHDVEREDLDFVVKNNDKQRYSYDDTGARIRANQGHSFEVDLDLEPVTPPDILFHGTNQGAVGAILAEGLNKMSRRHVHLSSTEDTALVVGARRGPPVVFRVDARSMAENGYKFYCSNNRVWLTDHVPREFLSLH